ncbi:platelet glycoprotein Ib beta chain [Podarcis muralis]
MIFLRLLLLLVFIPLVTPTCPEPCLCASTLIDCTAKDLMHNNLPTSFPPSTTKLYLNHNNLTSIPNGLFDNLKDLQVVHLWANPWECDCHILYLRSWLQWQQNRSFYRNVICLSPSHLQGRIISYLSEDEIISTCQYWYCGVALISQMCLFIFLLVQAVLLLLVIVYLRRIRRIAKEARRTVTEFDERGDTWSTHSRKGAD